jgi:hypothetical protein
VRHRRERDFGDDRVEAVARTPQRTVNTLKASGAANVLAWFDAQAIETLYVSTISLAGLRFGIAVLPDGKRRELLQSSLERRVLPLFAGRILERERTCA